MATTLRLQTREARGRLAAREEPYWLELRRGLAIGYRRGSDSGSWLSREYRGGRYIKRRLGLADDAAAADGATVLSWNQAQTVALGAERPTVTRPGKYTVQQAWEDYSATRRRGPPNASERGTWARYVLPKLGERPIAELATAELETWLREQAKPDAGRRRRGAENDPKERERRARYTANRRWNLLRAVLNTAFRLKPDRVPSDAAWRRVQPFQGVDLPRTRHLSAAEARRLIDALEPSLQPLARGSLLTALRLGELEALRAADVTGDAVHVRHSKSGKPRSVPLNPEGKALFAELVQGKTTDAVLFAPVSRVAVSRAMRTAGKAAGIDPPATFHDLRRSYGSLLINAGVSGDHIQTLLGHADQRMTRRHYAHLLDKTLQKSVRKLPALLGAPPPKKQRRVKVKK